MWQMVLEIELRPGNQDDIVCKLTSDVKYTTKSAYEAQFVGSLLTNYEEIILRPWASQSCMFFAWLADQTRFTRRCPNKKMAKPINLPIMQT